MKTILALALITVLSTTAKSAESDHYSRTDLQMVDISELVNGKANAYLKLGLSNLNAEGPCDDTQESELKLYEELRNYFANHGKGKLVQELLHDQTIPKRDVPKSESIYGNWGIGDGFLLGRPGSAKSQLGLMPLIQIGTIEIGVDKLEHMFGMGLKYHKRHNLEGDDLTPVLKNGIFREKTVLGGMFLATGVFSYGDLAANFNGMRFWNHILQKKDDVLGQSYNVGPYVKCIEGTWKTTIHEIDFRNYVDASMDESINCRKLATKGGLKRSMKAMEERGLKRDECPRDKEILQKVKAKYDVPMKDDPETNISHWIINMKGLGTVNYLNEFKN